jgi:hypothetical protein
VAGQYNSSLTRVQPVFGELLRRDGTGASWLPTLLRLATKNRDQAEVLAENPGALLSDRCFETGLPPPEAFLRWLLTNPDRLAWPRVQPNWSAETRLWRGRLRGDEGPEMLRQAQERGAALLGHYGASGSRRAWWAFEGFTSADCFLRTERLVLLVEGKRTDVLSPSTTWYPRRNQLVRNVEATAQAAGSIPCAVLLIADDSVDPLTAQAWDQSLPHLPPERRAALMRAYLGCVTWEDVCRAVGVDYSSLPATVADAVPLTLGGEAFSKLMVLRSLLGKDTCQIRIAGRGERGRRWNVTRIDESSETVDVVSDDGELVETGVPFNHLVISDHPAPTVEWL